MEEKKDWKEELLKEFKVYKWVGYDKKVKYSDTNDLEVDFWRWFIMKLPKRLFKSKLKDNK